MTVITGQQTRSHWTKVLAGVRKPVEHDENGYDGFVILGLAPVDDSSADGEAVVGPHVYVRTAERRVLSAGASLDMRTREPLWEEPLRSAPPGEAEDERGEQEHASLDSRAAVHGVSLCVLRVDGEGGGSVRSPCGER